MNIGRRKRAGEVNLLNAARMCNNEAIATLVQSRNIDIDVKDQTGCRAVHYSCKAADISSLGLLLEHGARTDVFDNDGMAPIHYAAEENYVETLALLICYEGDVNLKNKITGMTALHYACEFNNINVMKFLLHCGADFRRSDNTRKCPDIGPTLVKDNLEIQQAFKERKIITFGKMVQRMEKHVFSQANFTLENMNTDSKEFSFFCRTMPIEFVDTDTIFPSNLSEYLEYRNMEAVSDVYGYIVNQSATDVTVTVPIYSTPDKFDDISVHDNAGREYECQEIKQTKEGCFLVARMMFEAERDYLQFFIVLKDRKTDRHIVTGCEQTIVSSVEEKFVVCLPANCLPKDSSVEFKVHPTDGFNNTLNTSSFYEIQTENTLRKRIGLQLPCPMRRNTNEMSKVSVYNAQYEGTDWVYVAAKVVDKGDAVKVLDKSICNGTPGKVFTVKVDTGTNSVLGSSSLQLCYQPGRESYQEFIITGKEHDLVVVYISKRETEKSHVGNKAGGILTQINVELVKEISDANTVVGHKFDEYPDDRCLSWLADELGYKWAMVGVGNGLKYSYLESIERGNSARRTNLTMLYAWRKMLDLDIKYIHGVDTLVSCLILAGRYDLATEIRKHVKQLIQSAPTERICKCVESFPNWAGCLLGDLHEVKGTSVDKDRIKDSYAVISPFGDSFLIIIVIVIGFNLSVLYQLGVTPDRIEHINHHIKDSEAAMFKCLIFAKRGYSDETTFFDELLKALKHDRNNQAISDIRHMCMKWLGLKTRKPDERTERLEKVLDKYCTPK